jgi:coproporphyrinogen III oxidase-like Fe-S oxidoreductase
VLFSNSLAASYFAALRDELRSYHERGFEFSAVYVGGGTPTVLPHELAETLALIRSLFGVEEISVETNPNHLVAEVLDVLKVAGVNRLSVGVQSLDDDLLREMGRYSAYGSGEQIRERLRDASGVFDTLNVDMIFNFPHQSYASVDRDIDILTEELGVDQISFYPLMPVSSADSNASQALGELTFSREPRFYDLILDRMSGVYSPSSVWCFSKSKGMIDEYIVEQDNYIGAGSGAFSYFDGVFYTTSFSIDQYIRRVKSGSPAIIRGKRYTPLDQMRYDFLVRLFGLRLDGALMAKKYGPDWRRALWKELWIFRLFGALENNGDEIRLRRRGMYYWLVMMREFLTGVNNFRTEMRSAIAIEIADNRRDVSSADPVRRLEGNRKE